MLTLFQMTIAPGGWGKVGRLLIYKVNHYYWLFFIPYVWGVTFAIVRVISAIFLKETLAVAANDQQSAIREKTRKKDRDIEHLRNIFKCADKDGGGHICLGEFKSWLENPDVKMW